MTEKKIEKIGIDHGFRNMKTRNCIFDTALSKLPQKPDDLEGVLEYNNEYYCIYGRRVTSVDTHNKADSDEFYLLTLAAIAKELRARKTHRACLYLSVGLPQKWYFSQREAFVKAGIWLTRTIAERINAELYEDIPEAKILQYLLKGSREKQPANKYEEIMRNTVVEYCSQIYRILKEYKLNPLVVPVIFAGGGAGIIKRFGEYNPEMTDFIEDLRANAIGYEYLDELYYARKQG